jgi:hypothetical protein
LTNGIVLNEPNDTVINGSSGIASWNTGLKVGFSIGVSFGGLLAITIIIVVSYFLIKLASEERVYNKVSDMTKSDQDFNLSDADVDESL